jgi:hypothetical protein
MKKFIYYISAVVLIFSSCTRQDLLNRTHKIKFVFKDAETNIPISGKRVLIMAVIPNTSPGMLFGNGNSRFIPTDASNTNGEINTTFKFEDSKESSLRIDFDGDSNYLYLNEISLPRDTFTTKPLITVPVMLFKDAWLYIYLKNAEPFSDSDKFILNSFSKNLYPLQPFSINNLGAKNEKGYNWTGIQVNSIIVLRGAAGINYPIRYTVEKKGIKTTFIDSVILKSGVNNQLNINY